jgi:glycosyltransferase involved in cell wall biosynthesis/GT2 family glycosyltransferase
MFSFSVVINTYNRAEGLRNTLKSLLALDYPTFEIVVVNGPSTDHTEEVLQQFASRIKVASCEVRNLSVSRNIGICAAAGDLVAFIDDDAMPEPEWLTQLAEAFDEEGVAAAGGKVFDHVGYEFQYQYASADRLGNAQWQLVEPTPHLNFPQSLRFPYLQGTNTSFRRTALLSVGGFDEEYEYYLDETDVCLRLNDAGYIVRQLPNAYVHHKFLPSHVRDENRVAKYRYPVVKNKIYFAVRNARSHISMNNIMGDVQAFVAGQFADIDFHIAGGRLSADDRSTFSNDVDRAWTRGLQQGLSANRELITDEKLQRYGQPFKNALAADEIARLKGRKSIVLVSRDYPPGHAGGIATFNRDLAVALAAAGHTVVVITHSKDVNRVDFEDGVWVHRLVPMELARSSAAVQANVPQHIWNWSMTAHREVARLETHRSIDVVETPIWDCEGIAFALDKRWPLVVSLQTTMHFWLQSHPEYRQNGEWMSSFGQVMLNLERLVMQEADSIRSISAAIARDIESSYGFSFEKDRLVVSPLGLADRLDERSATLSPGDVPVVLFVGRLEPRKGIDVLLSAITLVLQSGTSARFRLLGDDSHPGPDGQTFREAFENSEAGRQCAGLVSFEGKVSDEVLRSAYASCDLFVAPSRFESFGLVFLEAMREGKPVVGCNAGGMPEVVAHEDSGLLVEPGDAMALAKAISRLLNSPEQRSQMGARGRQRFVDNFTAGQMATNSEPLYESAARHWASSASPCGGTTSLDTQHQPVVATHSRKGTDE